jgi:sugar (pentulose or hexulose) kinase
LARQIMADVFDTSVTRHRGEERLATRAAMVGALSASQSVAGEAAANHLLDTAFSPLAKSAKDFQACLPAARGLCLPIFLSRGDPREVACARLRFSTRKINR